jgi:hypothetical protein
MIFLKNRNLFWHPDPVRVPGFMENKGLKFLERLFYVFFNGILHE